MARSSIAHIARLARSRRLASWQSSAEAFSSCHQCRRRGGSLRYQQHSNDENAPIIKSIKLFSTFSRDFNIGAARSETTFEFESLSPSEARETFFQLTDVYHDKRSMTNKRILLSWQLLDRLVQDAESCNTVLDTDLLNRVLGIWRLRGTKEAESALEATDVYERIQAYHPHLVPDIKSFAILIDTAVKRGKNIRQVPQLVQRILSEMTLEPNTIFINTCLSAWNKSGLPEAPYKAEELLQEYVDIVDDFSFSLVVDTWARQPNAAQRAQVLLDTMKLGMEPSARTYASVLQAWVRQGRPQEAEAILHQMGTSDYKLYSAVLIAWADKKNAQRAEQILNQMIDHPSLSPNKQCFVAVISAYSKNGNAIKAEELLERMQQVRIKPNSYAFTAVLSAWANVGTHAAAERAKAILERMQELYQAGNQDLQLNTVAYTSVVNAFARSGSIEGVEKAEALIETMEELYHAGNPNVRPNIQTFTSVMSGYAKCESLDAAEKAEALLDKIEELHKSGRSDLQLNTFAFNAVIDAYSRSRSPKGAERAERVLDRMLTTFQNGNELCMPDRYSFTSVISALSKNADRASAERAQMTFDVMQEMHDSGVSGLKPDQHSYGALMSAWGRCGDPQAAEAVLERMQRAYKAGNLEAKPNAVVLNSIIVAHARSKGDRKTLARNALKVLVMMKDLYETGNKDMKPNAFTFNTVIHAFAACGDWKSAEEAQLILYMMEQYVDCGTVTYNSVIAAYTKIGETKAAEKAVALLHRMKKLYDDGNRNVKPDTITFNAIISAWVKASSKKNDDPTLVKRVEHYFQNMKALADAGHDDCKPDRITYSLLIKAWSTSKHPAAKKRIEDLKREREFMQVWRSKRQH